MSDWLEPFLDASGHKARRRWAPVYIRVLYGRMEHKSVQPIVAIEANALVGGSDAILAIDDTAVPKKASPVPLG